MPTSNKPRPRALLMTAKRRELLSAIADMRVTGQASKWWLDGWKRVTGAVRSAQNAGLVAAGDPPAAGKITAELTAAGREAVDESWSTGEPPLHLRHNPEGEPDDVA